MNEILKKTGKISSILSGLGATLVGLVILGIAAFAFFNHEEYDGVTTETICDIKEELSEFPVADDGNLNPEEQYEYTVFVDYTVDGKEYKHVEYGAYSSSMKVGQSVEIKYDVNDPSKIQSPGGKTIIIVFMILGGAVVVFGIYRTIKGFKVDKENPMFQVMR